MDCVSTSYPASKKRERMEDTPPMNRVAVDAPTTGHQKQQRVTSLEEEFDCSYGKLFRHLLESGVTPAPSEPMVNCLKKTFIRLSSLGTVVSLDKRRRVSCLQCPGIDPGPTQGGEVAVVMETRSDYNLLKSVEILGNAYLRDRKYQAAHHSYKLAHSYYAERFNHKFVKCREMKKKMARALLEWGHFEEVMEELKVDVQLEAYCNVLDAESTLYIKYAYGRSLLSTNQSLESVPYLSQCYLAYMNKENPENMEVLKTIIQIVMAELDKGKIYFAMSMAKRFLKIFSIRFQRCDCPVEVIEFVVQMCVRLRERSCSQEIAEMHVEACELHSKFGTGDSSLLASSIGCHLSREAPHFEESVDRVTKLHAKLLSVAIRDDAFTLRRLVVTTKLIRAWSKREQAIEILVDTYNQVSEFLNPNDPNYKIFWDSANDRLWPKDSEKLLEELLPSNP